MSLCALLGPAKRVSGMVGTAASERVVEGELMPVEVDDNAHITIDFGNACFGVVTTGFTIQKYKTPAIEIYGLDGTLRLETKPSWRWTDGLAHLVEAIETDREPLIRPEHGYHALEIMLAVQEAGRTGTTVEIENCFPAVSYDAWPVVARDRRARHNPSS